MNEHTQIDECLSTRGGHLFIEEHDTVDLIRQFGSPIFVLSEKQIRRNIQRYQKAFKEGWPDGPVKVLPAAKANWILAVQRILADEDCGCDVYSPGELTVALNAGFDPRFISVNGVPKDKEHIFRCVKEGVRITIDSLEEVDFIEQATSELGKTATVRLRLKPSITGFTRHSDFVPEGYFPTDIATMAYKCGLPWDMVMKVAPRIMAMKNVELVGFHEHHGRHHRSTRYWEEQMKSYAKEIGRVCKALDGFQPREIDIGGGFAVYRDPFNAATHYTEPMQLAAFFSASKSLRMIGQRGRYRILAKMIDKIVKKPNQKRAPSIEEYAAVCTNTLRKELPRNGIRIENVMLQVEPGRSLHGNAGIHLCTVKNIKSINKPFHLDMVIVDTTEFWFTGGRYEHHLHDYVFANKTDADMVDRVDIVGRSCFGDRLMPTVPVPEVEVGDIFALLDTGAYQEVSMSNFNAIPRPATILVTDDKVSVIRRAEVEEDVFRRDVVPRHLKRRK
jgi:diaminopimelate decarboxylase